MKDGSLPNVRGKSELCVFFNGFLHYELSICIPCIQVLTVVRTNSKVHIFMVVLCKLNISLQLVQVWM